MKTITYNPETHVLVPREPSEEMIRSAAFHYSSDEYTGFISTYKAALSAAPQPEPVESEPVYQVCMADSVSLSGAWIDVDKQTYHDAGLYAEYKLRSLYTTPQPDRTAELEAALKVARDGIDKFLVANDPTEFGCACDLSVGYLCGPCHADMQQEPLKIALAKINEVLK